MKNEPPQGSGSQTGGSSAEQLLKNDVEAWQAFETDLSDAERQMLAWPEGASPTEDHMVKRLYAGNVLYTDTKCHLLGQDILAEGFEAAALTLRGQRCGTNMVLVGTSCIANLALLKSIVKSKTETPLLVILDCNERVDQFWDRVKECRDDDAGFIADLAEIAAGNKIVAADKESFVRVIEGAGNSALETKAHELLFSKAGIFGDRTEIVQFYKRVLNNMIFVSADHTKSRNVDGDEQHLLTCHQKIRMIKTRIDQFCENDRDSCDVVFYGSNTYSFLQRSNGEGRPGSGSVMGAWVVGLGAGWIIASDLFDGRAPKNCRVLKVPDNGWAANLSTLDCGLRAEEPGPGAQTSGGAQGAHD